ncbi:unnamed protein product, partial [marine sediment metagenome]
MGGLSSLVKEIKRPFDEIEESITGEQASLDAIDEGVESQRASGLAAIDELRDAREAAAKQLAPFTLTGLSQARPVLDTLGAVETPGTAGQNLLNLSLSQGGTPDDLTGLARAANAGAFRGVANLGETASALNAQGAGGVADLSGRVSNIQGLGPDFVQEAQGLGSQQRDLAAFGEGALGRAQGLQGQVLDPNTGVNANFANSPQFQALQDQATRNVEQSAAARGKLGAGGTKEA